MPLTALKLTEGVETTWSKVMLDKIFAPKGWKFVDNNSPEAATALSVKIPNDPPCVIHIMFRDDDSRIGSPVHY